MIVETYLTQLTWTRTQQSYWIGISIDSIKSGQHSKFGMLFKPCWLLLSSVGSVHFLFVLSMSCGQLSRIGWMTKIIKFRGQKTLRLSLSPLPENDIAYLLILAFKECGPGEPRVKPRPIYLQHCACTGNNCRRNDIAYLLILAFKECGPGEPESNSFI